MFEKIGIFSKKFNNKLVFIYIHRLFVELQQYFSHQFSSLHEEEKRNSDGQKGNNGKENNGKIFHGSSSCFLCVYLHFRTQKTIWRKKAFFHQDFDKLLFCSNILRPPLSHWIHCEANLSLWIIVPKKFSIVIIVVIIVVIYYFRNLNISFLISLLS